MRPEGSHDYSRDSPSRRIAMPDRDNARLDARKLLPLSGRAERRHQPEALPVLDVVEERPAVRHRRAFVLLACRKRAVAAQVLRAIGVGPRDCVVGFP